MLALTYILLYDNERIFVNEKFPVRHFSGGAAGANF